MRKQLFLLSLWTLGSWAQGSQNGTLQSDRDIFVECLKEYKNFKEVAQNEVVIDQSLLQLFGLIDDKTLDLLEEGQRKSRFQKYNGDFAALKSGFSKLSKQLLKEKKRLEEMPLTTNNKARLDLELKVNFFEQAFRTAKVRLVQQSLSCNKSLTDFVTLDPKSRKALEAKAAAAVTGAPVRKVLPGRAQGSRVEREKAAAADKLNLTPVDREFYQTQLGKKLLRDLGNQVDYWSYDYQRDELYVQVGDEVAKIGVTLDAGGARYIKTRVGPRFDIPKAPDEAVERDSQGRFMTGDKSQDSLFGKMPSNQPKLEDEKSGTHSKDGHAH